MASIMTTRLGKTRTRWAASVALALALALGLVLLAGRCSWAATDEAAMAADEAAEDEAAQGERSGAFVEPAETILTPEGEIALDPESGRPLPEQTNDGELEGGDHHADWSYDDQTGWAGEYPLCRGAKMRQSPIDIQTGRVLFNSRMRLEFVDYAQEVEFEYKNTHHSVSLAPIASLATPSVRVHWVDAGERGDENLYELQEIHFHWGDGLNKGSEHKINDERAAAEMHMVHYRRGLDKTRLGSEENSVVVIGVFIESDVVKHNKLEKLVARAKSVNGTDAQYKDMNPENLINLLPENHHSFYTYNGSLTTPPCYEVVTWIIMSEPVYMCQDQLAQLANLETLKPGGAREKIASNRRDIQPLLGRPVYASFNTTESTTLQMDHIGKRIGRRHGRLSKALNEYWTRVNKIKVSVRKAYKSIKKARDKLLHSLGLNKHGGQRKRERAASDATDATDTTDESPPAA